MAVEQMTGVPSAPETEQLMGVHNYERKTGEDCLVLNLWAPANSHGGQMPVLVWLHGGGWSVGSSSWPLYEFDNLARRDTVVVSLNHRVGILGFLDVSDLGDEFEDSGNVGMLDIVAALSWIRDNIGAFGGDPSNVTVFGESGGGAKVATLLAMPAARGLLSNAVAMSGSMLIAQAHEQASGNLNAALSYLEFGRDRRALEGVAATGLIDAEVHLPGRDLFGGARGVGPVLGPSLPQHPVDAIAAGSSRNVVLVSGCNGDEMLAFITDPDLWTLGMDDLDDRVRRFLGSQSEEIVALYKEVYPDESPTSLLIAIATDAYFRVPQIRLAEAHIKGGGQATFMYLYQWGFVDPTGRMRSPHGLDMPYFFDNVARAPLAAGPNAASLLSMMGAVLPTLAATGTPCHRDLPNWPPYSLDQRETMCISLPAVVQSDPLAAARKCWTGVELGGCPNWIS
jgi:para-nitrobenzyl esterase